MRKITALIAAGALLASVSGALAASAGTAAPAPAAAAPAMPAHSHHAMMMHSKHVKAIQAALNSNGEQIAVDGRWGPKTRSALMDFQQKNGLKATGRADKATLQKLNVSM